MRGVAFSRTNLFKFQMISREHINPIALNWAMKVIKYYGPNLSPSAHYYSACIRLCAIVIGLLSAG